MASLQEDRRIDEQDEKCFEESSVLGAVGDGGDRAAHAAVRTGRNRVGSLAPMLAGIAVLSAAVGLSFAVYLPMIRQAHLNRCQSQLKQIGVALLEYEANHRHYPAAAITDRGGRPLLSWRVAILPQLGLRSLYDEFHLDEP